MISMGAMPLYEVEGKHTTWNPYFDPWDSKLFSTYTEAKKWSRMYTAFAISMILALMFGRPPPPDTPNFYNYLRSVMQKPKHNLRKAGNHMFWLFHVA